MYSVELYKIYNMWYMYMYLVGLLPVQVWSFFPKSGVGAPTRNTLLGTRFLLLKFCYRVLGF